MAVVDDLPRVEYYYNGAGRPGLCSPAAGMRACGMSQAGALQEAVIVRLGRRRRNEDGCETRLSLTYLNGVLLHSTGDWATMSKLSLVGCRGIPERLRPVESILSVVRVSARRRQRVCMGGVN